MNEEAKRSMIEWQEKLDKVTKDSEERISELQHKLAKVSHVEYRISWFMDHYNSPKGPVVSDTQTKQKFVRKSGGSSYKGNEFPLETARGSGAHYEKNLTTATTKKLFGKNNEYNKTNPQLAGGGGGG